MEKVLKDALIKKTKLTDILSNESEFALHFDGKRLNGTEFVVVCFQGLNEFYKLRVCEC